MAKSTGKEKGRSTPQGKGGGERQGKQNPDASRHGSGGAARNGAAGRKENSQARAQSRGQEQAESGQLESGQKRPGGAGRAIGGKVKEHPITAAAVGAGVALLAAQGLRMALGANSNPSRGGSDESAEDSSAAEDSGEETEQDEDSGDENDQEDEGDEGGGLMGRLRGGASRIGSAFGGSADAVKRGASSGFGRGREAAAEGWQNHPLLLCGLALAVGAGVGMLLPSSRQEDRLMGESADKVTGRIRSAGQEFFRQGRQIAGKVVGQAVSATSKEAEREGLTPDRLGKKVKRLVGHVRDAVSEAIDE